MKLYHAANAPCVQKVRLVLAEKELSYQSHLFDLSSKEHLNEAYLKINPMGVVPTLIDQGYTISESTVTCEYLEDAYALKRLHQSTAPIVFSAMLRPKLLKKSPEKRAELLAKVPNRPRRERQVRLIEQGFDAPDVVPAFADWKYGLSQTERMLEGREWLINDEYSMADANLLPYVEIVRKFHVSSVFEKLPNLAVWHKRSSERPSYSTAISKFVTGEYTERVEKAGVAYGERIGEGLAL